MASLYASSMMACLTPFPTRKISWSFVFQLRQQTCVRLGYVIAGLDDFLGCFDPCAEEECRRWKKRKRREEKVEKAGLDPAAAAPSQPDRLDGSRSDHSAGSKESASWRALRQWFGLTRSTGLGKPNRCLKARHEADSFEPAEWSERLPSRRSGWLGAAAAGSSPAFSTFFSLLFLLFWPMAMPVGISYTRIKPLQLIFFLSPSCTCTKQYMSIHTLWIPWQAFHETNLNKNHFFAASIL